MSSDTQRDSSPSLSFLDVIACAFGAIVLLVLIVPIGELGTKGSDRDQSAEYGSLLYTADALAEEIADLNRQIATNEELVENLTASMASSTRQNQAITKTIDATESESDRIRQLISATQQAHAIVESKEVVSNLDTNVSGIPADSEYVVFIIDTSSSMSIVWPQVEKEVQSVLSLYPDMKGFQVMNDQGGYLVKERAGRWMQDSIGARRKLAIQIGRRWGISASSPTKGIETALRDLYKPDIKMAIYVFGDDYSNPDLEGFLNGIDQIVQSNSVVEGTLRIHGLGFAHMTEQASGMFQFAPRSFNPDFFAVLMRELADRYDGAFLALNRDY